MPPTIATDSKPEQVGKPPAYHISSHAQTTLPVY